MIFNGRDLVNYCGQGFSINKEIPPGMVGRSITTIGGAGGRLLGHAEDAPCTYTARVNIHGATMADAWIMRRKLAQWAYSDGLADLVPTHDSTHHYRAICQSVSDPEFKWGACTVTVTFLLPDARLLENGSNTYSGTGSATFYRTGSAEPIIVVTFTPTSTVSAPTIKLNGTTVFGMTGTVSSGVPCVVDFDQKTLKVNGSYALNRISYNKTDWHPAFQGNSNTVVVTNASVSVEVTNRWL